jgi:1,4-dihydroxy-2-naphthoyl-CoA hydrolase
MTKGPSGTSPIWRVQATPEQLIERARNTLAEHLGIRITEVGPDYLRATMPVNTHTHQPNGILHGGASVALAETIGSVAANLCVDMEKFVCVGQEINANHVRSVASGLVTGTARPFHIGGRSQVWGIEIRDESDKLICVSRITMAVVERK